MSPDVTDRAPNPNGANASNWRTWPFNRWAFHNVREIVPTAGIAAAPGRALPVATPASLSGFSLKLPNGASLDLRGFLKATFTDAMVILHRGRIVHEFYDGGTMEHTPHILMSGTKAIVGLIAGILHRNGDLSLGGLVSDYVPEIGKTGYQGATVRQLLDMRAGVALDNAEARAYGTAVHGNLGGPDEAAPGLHEFLQTLGRNTPHAGPFSYVSPNTDLLGWAIERATGKSFPKLVSELLWQPMGADHAANIIVDREGSPWCSGGLSATARDFARLGGLLANDGRDEGNEILPKAWIDDLCDNGDRDAWENGEWGKSFAAISGNMSYRAGWYAVHDDPKHIFAMGVHGQNLFVDRANQLVIAKLSSQASRIDAQSIALTHMAVAELRRCLLAT